MVPEISTRLAAASPRPEKASSAASRDTPPAYSPGPSLFCPAPPADGPPSFLDSNPSDPMTPDPTHQLRLVHAATNPEHAAIHDQLTTAPRESLESKDNT